MTHPLYPYLNASLHDNTSHFFPTVTVPIVDEFVTDVQSVVQDVLASPADTKGNMTAIYGLGNSSAAGPALVKEIASTYIDTLFYCPV